MGGEVQKDHGLEVATAYRSSTRLAGRQRLTSKSTLSEEDIDGIQPVVKRPKRTRAKAAARTMPVAKKKKRTTRQSSKEERVSQEERTKAATATDDKTEMKDKFDGNMKNKTDDDSSHDAESVLCSVPSIDTLLSDEEDIAEFNKYFRVKSQREVEAVATGIVRATNKPRVTRKMLEERKKKEADMKVKPIPRHPVLHLNYLPKNRTVSLFLNPNQLDADILEILGKTPGAFDIANKQAAAKAAAAAKMAPEEKAMVVKEAAKNMRKKPAVTKKTPPKKKTSPRKGAISKRAPAPRKPPATRGKKAGKKGKSSNPAIDSHFEPHGEHKGYITCLNCGKMLWPPNREKHLPKCPGLHPNLETA